MRSAIVVALLACLPLAARAQRLPETPAGRQLAGWLAAFNDERPESMQRFVETHVDASSRRQLLSAGPGTTRFRERTGGFELKKVETSAPTRLSVLLQERGSDQIARFEIVVDSAPPHRVASLSGNAVPRPPDLALPRLSESALATALRQRLEREAASGQFAGAVLVAQEGRTLFEGAYGLADREKGVKNTLDTRFRIGSMNKMFTAVAVLQLAQAGKLRLDAPVGTYLTRYPNKDVASKVTIHHLLTHTGGTGDIFGPEFDAKRTSLRTIQDYVDLYGTRAPEFEPGNRFEYSNFGYILLGAVIEKVSGRSYYDFVASSVFAPAGMTSTASLPEDSVVANRSVGYTRGESGGEARPNNASLPYRGSSAGGGYSTVRDLSRFAAALRQHKLLDAKHVELLTTGKKLPGGGGYAYGFQERMIGGARIVGHGGGAPGMNGDLAIDLRSGQVVVVLANLDPPAAQRVSEFIVNRLPAAGLTP